MLGRSLIHGLERTCKHSCLSGSLILWITPINVLTILPSWHISMNATGSVSLSLMSLNTSVSLSAEKGHEYFVRGSQLYSWSFVRGLSHCSRGGKHSSAVIFLYSFFFLFLLLASPRRSLYNIHCTVFHFNLDWKWKGEISFSDSLCQSRGCKHFRNYNIYSSISSKQEGASHGIMNSGVWLTPGVTVSFCGKHFRFQWD